MVAEEHGTNVANVGPAMNQLSVVCRVTKNGSRDEYLISGLLIVDQVAGWVTW